MDALAGLMNGFSLDYQNLETLEEDATQQETIKRIEVTEAFENQEFSALRDFSTGEGGLE